MEFKREKSQNIYLLNKYHALIQYDIEFIVKVGNLLIAPFLSVQIYSIFFRSFSFYPFDAFWTFNFYNQHPIESGATGEKFQLNGANNAVYMAIWSIAAVNHDKTYKFNSLNSD